MSNNSTGSDQEVQALARAAAGLMALMAVDITEYCRELGIKNVAFMTREGIAFKRYYDAFATAHGDMPASTLLEVSRISTFSASLSADGTRGLGRLTSQYANLDRTQLMASLNAYAPDCAPPPIEAKHNPVLLGDALIHRLAADAEFDSWLRILARQRRQNFLGYIEHHHPWLRTASNVLVIDVGWRGTIQDNLAHLIPELRWHGLYLGLFPFINAQPTGSTKKGILFDEPAGRPATPDANVFPVEFLFQVAEGSVTGYHDGKAVRAQAQPDTGLPFALDFQSRVIRYANVDACAWRESDEGARVQLHMSWKADAGRFWGMTQAPSPALYGALRQYCHDESFGVGRTVQLDRLLSFSSFLRAVFSNTHRRLFIQHSTAIPESVRSHSKFGWWLHLVFFVQRLTGYGKKIANRKQQMKDVCR